jgi:hypothetical protein
MKIRIYETNNMDLDTVEKMLFQADKQTNFHPDSFWILSSSEGEKNNFDHDETRLSKRFKELCVKWIGREAVIMWLVSNQVPFEIITFKLLEEELEAIGEINPEDKLISGHTQIN